MATVKIDLQTEDMTALAYERTREAAWGYLVEDAGVYMTLDDLIVDVIGDCNLTGARNAGKWTHLEDDGRSLDFYYIEQDCVDGDCEHTFETDKTECDTPNIRWESVDYKMVTVWKK
jgi:hypothetical protein